MTPDSGSRCWTRHGVPSSWTTRDRLVEAVLANSRGFASSIGEVDEEKLSFLEMALDRLASDRVERALVLATICPELTYGGAVERRSAMADEAIEIARAAGDDVAVVSDRDTAGRRAPGPHWLDRFAELIADAAVRVQRIGDPALVALVDDCRGNIATWSGDVAMLDRILAPRQSARRPGRRPFLRWTLAMTSSLRARHRRRLRPGTSERRPCLHVGTAGNQPEAALMHAAQCLAVSWMRGSMGERVPILAQVVDDNPGIPALTGLPGPGQRRRRRPRPGPGTAARPSSPPTATCSPRTTPGWTVWWSTPRLPSSGGTPGLPRASSALSSPRSPTRSRSTAYL